MFGIVPELTMTSWLSFVELLRVTLFALAHVCGGSLGGAIVMLSLIVRLALLPLTLRLAMRARDHQEAIRRLAPEMERLQKRHAKDPARLAQATGELYAANGIGLVPKGTLLGTAIQMPIGAGVYQTIATSAHRAARFLWISDLSKPDILVASIAAGLTGAAVTMAPSSTSRGAAILAASVTFLVA